MTNALVFNLTILLKYLEKESVCICNESSWSFKHIRKINGRTKLWLCAVAGLSLTEQKKIGDSVVLFVASSTTLPFRFT
jgi:hypothetical protein